jgi:carboxypeptidase C (cathepsin A)
VPAFTKELLRDQSRTVGRLDSRYKGIDRVDATDSYEYDPSYSAILGPYTAALNAYVREELEWTTDVNYEILTGRVRPWKFPDGRFVDVSETLRASMSKNPALRVWVANGYFDLATPFFASEHTVARMGLDPSLRGNVTMTYYKSGHMMYVRQADLEQLKKDAAEFYTKGQ